MEVLKIRAIPVDRGAGKIMYVAALTFGGLAKMFDEEALYIANDPRFPDFAQRKENPRRVRSAKNYILRRYQSGSVYFPPVCVNLQVAPEPVYADGFLHINYARYIFRLTDGQTRSRAVRAAIIESREKCQWDALDAIRSLGIGAQIYINLPLQEERQVFYDQNSLASKLPKTLADSMDSSSPVHAIARALTEQVHWLFDSVGWVDSHLSGDNARYLLTFATLVTATEFMFGHLKREGYELNDLDIEPYVDWATLFWEAVEQNLTGNPWQLHSEEERQRLRDETICCNAVFFKALGRLANDLRQEDEDPCRLTERLSVLADIDWRRSNPMWVSEGVVSPGSGAFGLLANTNPTIDRLHKILRRKVRVGSNTLIQSSLLS